jgi:hypothetical protein
MKRKLLWLDLIICSVWILAVLGDRGGWGSLLQLIVLLMAVLRLSFAFSITKLEKRSWMPLVGMAVLTALMLQVTGFVGIDKIGAYSFYISGLEWNGSVYRGILLFSMVWIWLLPLIVFFIFLFCRKLIYTEMKWTDLFGGILWKDCRARIYSALMLVCIITFYVGLSMNARACQIISFTAPVFSYWLLCRHYHVNPKRIGLVVVSMIIFFYAQPFAGLWRGMLLTVSLGIVVYMSLSFYRATQVHSISVLTILYVGIFLPSLSIGYNQYACLSYGRWNFYSYVPFNGIFYIQDASGNMLGLRDRYGMLVKPEYESICSPDDNLWNGDVELRTNGFSVYYDLYAGNFKKVNGINEELQVEVGKKVKDFLNKYKKNDRIEVKITESSTSKIIGHVKMIIYGVPQYYYGKESFWPEDTVILSSDKFSSDTFMTLEYGKKNILRYTKDLMRDSIPVYRIDVKIATGLIPQKSMIAELVNNIAKCKTLNVINQ